MQCTLHLVNDMLRIRQSDTARAMLEVTSLGSGSSGNALLIRTAGKALLVDCGVGVKRMTSALATQGLGVAQIDALLISHEHSDHVRELPRFAAAGAAVMSTAGTAAAAPVPDQSRVDVVPMRTVSLAGADITALPVTHDARQPCGFLIRTTAGSVTVLTDLGCAPPEAVEAISESNLVVLEANHDEGVLRRGPYPAHLQRRILSDAGHLSNAACAELLVAALRGSRRLPTIWLAHLSATNNRPHLAVQSVNRALARAGIRLDVAALPRRETGATWRASDENRGVSQLMLEFAT